MECRHISSDIYPNIFLPHSIALVLVTSQRGIGEAIDSREHASPARNAVHERRALASATKNRAPFSQVISFRHVKCSGMEAGFFADTCDAFPSDCAMVLNEANRRSRFCSSTRFAAQRTNG
jgi:hypothetical protein